MNRFRIALAHLPYPATPTEALRRAEEAVAAASAAGAGIVCFPECYVPGYRWPGRPVPAHDPSFLRQAWDAVAAAARRGGVAVILGTERTVGSELRISALVLGPDGAVLGWQDKVQLDPSEDATFRPGAGRQFFQVGPLTFGVVICHEGWRYPETVRQAVRRGAQVVFHPHYGEAEPGAFRPTRFGEPENTFHDRAVLCRAAENTCWFASVNCAGEGAPTTSAIAAPDGTLHAWQPHATPGLLVADLDLDLATGLLARRLREG
jgi:predicted amidohydrolase